MEEKQIRDKAIRIDSVTHEEFTDLQNEFNGVTGEDDTQEGFIIRMMRVFKYFTSTSGYSKVYDAMKYHVEQQKGVGV